MANLSKLVLAPRPTPAKSDPFLAMKAALIANLERQLTSARAMVDGKPCPEVKRKWYFRDGEGKVRLRLRLGVSVLELGDGITDVVVGEDQALPKAIETVLAAVKAGELDETIRKAIESRKAAKKAS